MTGEQGERDDSTGRPPDETTAASSHPDLDTLSAWAAGASTGVVDDQRLAAHVAGCAACTEELDALAQVSTLLAVEPPPPMPADVFARLDDVVAMESASRIAVGASTAHRSAGASHQAEPTPPHLPPPPRHGPVHGDPHPRPLLGSLADRPRGRPGRRRLGRVLGGLVLAGVLGCAAYVLSASVGLNEPTAVNPVSVDPSTLQSEAVTAEDSELSPHRFSRAWRCAREVTDGSITGIRPVVVDGDPSYLVYTSDDDTSAATLVTGCADGSPKAGPSVEIPDR